MDTLTRIGNETDALVALDEALFTFQYNKGNHYGSGGNRKAFLINDVIYKVHHEIELTSNQQEYDFWVNTLSKVTIPEDIRVRFVPVEMYELDIDGEIHHVNAMPFIDGKPIPGVLAGKEGDFAEDLGLFDTYGDNVLILDGYYYIVDGEQ